MNSDVNQSKTSDWVSWEFKRQRPDKVPGCQDVASLPHLEEAETTCGEGQYCFYFSCVKCSSLLALETLNPDYINRIQYVPRISCIPVPEAFTEENKYHGEIHEMYQRYFSQISDLRGVAVNGWSSENAHNLFKHVGDTFKHREKFVKVENFEIDWILFTGETITVIEVKEKSKTAKKDCSRTFEKKVDQIKKDKIIMQHLLEVCGCKDTQINYVIACPNVAITEVTEGTFLGDHKDFLREISETGDRLGFIAEDSMVTGDVYIYKKETSTVEKTSFSEMLGSPDNVSRSHLWEGSYSLVTSSVILSVLVVGNGIDNSSKHLVPGRCNFELKQNKKITRRLCRNMPAAMRNNFPEFLVLGPEQLKIIEESKHHNKIVLLGGAGCGKTFILLYMLYKNTSKYLIESDCKNVVFAIPDQKTKLKAFVEKFVQYFCNPNYVYIQSFEYFRHFNIPETSKLILFDEIYSSYFYRNFAEFSHVSAKIVFAVGLFDGMLFDKIPNLFPFEWKIYPLQASYRNPCNISSLCKKLGQLAYMNRPVSKPFVLTMTALDSSLKVNDEDSIQIKHIKYCPEIGKEIAERKEETLLVADDRKAFKSAFLNQYTFRVNVSARRYQVLLRNLAFTGVQYKSVVIILKERRNISRAISTILYHSISRATHRVILLTPNPEFYKTLLTATPADLKVLEKLRRYQNIPKEDLLLLTEEGHRSEALELAILTENWSMLDSLIETFTSGPDASTIQKDTIRFLLGAFPRIESGKILHIISKNFGQTIDIQQMLIGYIDSSTTISMLPNGPGRIRMRLLEQFMELMPGRNLYADFFYLSKSCLYQAPLIEASLIWGDKNMIMQHKEMTRNELHIFSRQLSEISSKLPETMKESFKCVELSPEEIIKLQHNEKVFADCSKLTKDEEEQKFGDGSLRYWGTDIICSETASKMFSGSDNCRVTFMLGFCSFFHGVFSAYSSEFCSTFSLIPTYVDDILDKVVPISKDEVIPISQDEAIQRLEDLITTQTTIYFPDKSSIEGMGVLLARIYATSIEVSNATID